MTSDPTTTLQLEDAEVRQQIGGHSLDLSQNLFVEAGAGTGKTTSLVARLVAAAIRAGAEGMHRIVAMTFTEAAAAELRTRVRGALSDHRDGDVRLLASRVDDMTIGTIHGFARALLSEHGIAVGVPPGFDVVDEATRAVEHRGAWDRILRALLADPAARPTLARGRALGLAVRDLGQLADGLDRHWDRLERPPVSNQLSGWTCRPEHWEPVSTEPLRAALEALASLAQGCTDPEDKLLGHIVDVVVPTLEDLRNVERDAERDFEHTHTHERELELTPPAQRGAEPATLARLRFLAGVPKLSSTLGRQEAWSGTPVETVRARARDADDLVSGCLATARRQVVQDLTARVATFVVQAAEDRRRTGRLGYDDLLVLAERLASEHPEVLDAIRDRYRWIFLDEFQDTDPLQTRLALGVAGAEGAGRPNALRAGALFVVGDPKQSIYRFRGADIAQFLETRPLLDVHVQLDCNFRSVPGIVEWVNVVCARIFGHDADQDQAPFRALVATRDPDPGTEAAVSVLGSATTGTATDRRVESAAAVAGAIRHIVASATPWKVHAEVRGGTSQEDWEWQRARWSDVAVLFPARTHLETLQRALDDADIPYRLEGSNLLWASQEVRDLLAVLRAADRPADSVSVLAALRSPLFGCGDDELLAYARSSDRRWDPLDAADAGHRRGPVGSQDGRTARRVADGLATLARYHRLRWVEAPATLLARVISERGALELALVHRRPRDRWQRVRWLLDQVRQFDEEQGGSLAELLRWADAQQSAPRAGAPTVPPDPDDDAVRLMTVHGSKGLEFPVVVLTGLDSAPDTRRDTVLCGPGGGIEVCVGSKDRGRFDTVGFDACQEVEHRLDELERLRVLYVATTRARDRLVVDLHRSADRPSIAADLAEALEECEDLWRPLEPELDAEWRPGTGLASPAGPSFDPEPVPPRPSWEEELEAWRDETGRALEAGRRRPVVTAMRLLDSVGGEARPDPADPDVVESVRFDADSGLRRGRAVHDALAALDLERRVARRDGAPAEAVARACAARHGLGDPSEQAEVVRLVHTALEGPLAQLVRGRPVFQELPVALPLEEIASEGPGSSEDVTTGQVEPAPISSGRPILEGSVDLVIEYDDGYLIIDYKTSGETGHDGALARYRPQLAAYALAVQRVTNRPVRGACLYLLGPAEARLEPLRDLREAITELLDHGIPRVLAEH